MLEKTLESPLDYKEIKPVNPNGNQPWIFIGRTDAKAEAPLLWLPDTKSQLIGKDTDAGKYWGKEEKGVAEGEMVPWCHWLNAHTLEQTPWYNKGQGNLIFYSPWDCRVRHDLVTEQQQPRRIAGEISWTSYVVLKTSQFGQQSLTTRSGEQITMVGEQTHRQARQQGSQPGFAHFLPMWTYPPCSQFPHP